jgi:hypothetical protein
MGLFGRVLLIAGGFGSAVAVALSAGRAPEAASQTPVPAPESSPARLGVVAGSDDPHRLDLAQLVPRGGTINHVWFVPQGRGRTQLLVAWQRGNNAYWERRDPRRYALTLWNPEGKVRNRGFEPRDWVPHPLVSNSPWPIADSDGGSAIRLADVTRDGRPDLLVTIGCRGCNHGTSVVFVAATFGQHVRKIYGRGFLTTKDPKVGVHGRVISESYWGSKNGLLWFDRYYDHWLSDKRFLTFLRWTDHGWRTVSQSQTTREEIERLHLHD